MNVIGLDIGGANIKVANADGNTASVPFAIWMEKESLSSQLAAVVAKHFTTPDLIALTMTAELADCFVTKAEGVEFVIAATEAAFPNVPIRVWLTSGEFVEPADAIAMPELAGAANWHVLATWAAQAIPDGPALLIDVGSTTTDIIPLLDGRPVPAGTNDCSRMLCGELVYSGSRRTPICAVTQTLQFRGRACPVAAEFFATMADAFLVLQQLEEGASNSDTSDGRPFTRTHSLNRMAHTICCDATELAEDEIVELAQSAVDAQLMQLTTAAEQVLNHLEQQLVADEHRTLSIEKPSVLISGSGAFVATRLLSQLGPERFAHTLDVTTMYHRPVAEAACAFAAARLAHTLCRDDLLEFVKFV